MIGPDGLFVDWRGGDSRDLLIFGYGADVWAAARRRGEIDADVQRRVEEKIAALREAERAPVAARWHLGYVD